MPYAELDPGDLSIVELWILEIGREISGGFNDMMSFIIWGAGKRLTINEIGKLLDKSQKNTNVYIQFYIIFHLSKRDLETYIWSFILSRTVKNELWCIDVQVRCETHGNALNCYWW